MELLFPPPHYLLFEPLNDVETLKLWNDYKTKHEVTCEFDEIDATEMNSVATLETNLDQNQGD